MELLPGETRRILVVDDDEHLRQMTAAILERQGFTVLQAADGNEAVDVWRSEKEPIDLLFVDLVLPGIAGPEVAKRFLADRKGSKVLFASGHDLESAADIGIGIEGARFLKKPYSIRALTQELQFAFANAH